MHHALPTPHQGSRKQRTRKAAFRIASHHLILLIVTTIPWLYQGTRVAVTTPSDPSVVGTSLTSFATTPSARALNDDEPAVLQEGNGARNASTSVRLEDLIYAQANTSVHQADQCYTFRDQIPSFIIAGAQKAGTTALFMMLRQHPNLLSTTKIEAHFFDHMPAVWNETFSSDSDATSLTDEQVCVLRRDYRDAFGEERLRKRQRRLSHTPTPRLVTLEKTPVYLCLQRVPEYVHRIAPWAKIVIMLRNPIDRAVSGFYMRQTAVQIFTNLGGDVNRLGRRGMNAMPTSFDEMVSDEVRGLRALGLSQAPGLALYKHATSRNVTPEHVERLCQQRNLTCTFTTDTLQRLDNIQASLDSAREARRMQCGTLARGLYAQQLVPWLRYFTLDQTLLVVRYERFLSNRSAVLSEILDFVGAPPFANDLTNSTTLSKSYSPYGKHQTTHEPLDTVTREYLRQFYKPYNDELADLLGDEWRDVWD